MAFFTADLCDEYPEKVQALGPDFKSYARSDKTAGEVITVKLDKNNKDLAALLKNENGKGKIVVVDVDMQYYAVVGDNLMKFAFENEYRGIIVNGYIRDTKTVKEFDMMLMAKGVCPRKYIPAQDAQIGCDLEIDGVTICNGDYIYIDSDGIVVTKEKIL